jgi:hypothetical protein
LSGAQAPDAGCWRRRSKFFVKQLKRIKRALTLVIQNSQKVLFNVTIIARQLDIVKYMLL